VRIHDASPAFGRRMSVGMSSSAKSIQTPASSVLAV
jgi:hypothetical protein